MRRRTHALIGLLAISNAWFGCDEQRGNEAVASVATPTAAAGPRGFQTTGVVLYQPDSVLAERVPSSQVLSAYMKEIQASCASRFQESTAPEALDVVVALKPGGLSRTWFVTSARSEDDRQLSDLKRDIEALSAPPINGGPVAFAIVGSIAGAPRPAQGGAGYRPPMPKAWTEVAQRVGGQGVLPDDVLRHIWP